MSLAPVQQDETVGCNMPTQTAYNDASIRIVAKSLKTYATQGLLRILRANSGTSDNSTLDLANKMIF